MQGFLRKTHEALEVALRKAAKEALNEVAAKATPSVGRVVRLACSIIFPFINYHIVHLFNSRFARSNIELTRSTNGPFTGSFTGPRRALELLRVGRGVGVGRGAGLELRQCVGAVGAL